MKTCIIIPAFNEEKNIIELIQCFSKQTHIPNQIIIVDDNSTDNTFQIGKKWADKFAWLKIIKKAEGDGHQPGAKVIDAFDYGLKDISLNDFDLIGKFDADIILPSNYFEKIIEIFASNRKIGIAGGNLYIVKENKWVFENISEKTKVRGPIKLYRKECLQNIGGLRRSIGWDTVDELLAQYHGWKIKTDPSLHVKHLKPTGAAYSKSARFKQGEAFYKMRYGWGLTVIASAKLAARKNNFQYFIDCVKGFRNAEKDNLPFIVSEKEGEFIRNLRWQGIKKKLLP